jgi:general secretion pathway protein D
LKILTISGIFRLMSRKILLNNWHLSKVIAIAMISLLISISESASAEDQKKEQKTTGRSFPWVKIEKKATPKKTTAIDQPQATSQDNKKVVVSVKSDKVATAKDVKLKKPAFNLEDKAKQSKTKPAVLSVARQLEKLLKPSDALIMARQKHKTDPPYFKIIKGSNNQSTLIYRCRFIQATKTLSNSLSTIISAEGSVECSEEQNMVILHDASNKMDELRDSLLALDVSSPQVLVEAKIVEVVLTDGMQREFSLMFNKSQDGFAQSGGIETSIPGQRSSADGGANLDWLPILTGTAEGNFKNMNVALEWLLNSHNARILSSPNVIVSRNTTASIVTGQDIPIQEQNVVSGSTNTSTKFKRVGVTLDVTPRLINNNSVRLVVNPQVSSVQGYQEIDQGAGGKYSVPIISIRNVSTELTLKDGQIIIIGGLFSHVESLQQERIPFISDIPYIGELFTGKNKSLSLTQLIFFLKVNILTEKELDGGVLYDPAVQAQTIRKVSEVIRDSEKIFPKPKSSIEQAKEEFIDKSPAYR